MSQNSDSGTMSLTHYMHFEITLAQVIPGYKTIGITLEERQVSEQIQNFINIASENISMSKTNRFVEPLSVLSLR